MYPRHLQVTGAMVYHFTRFLKESAIYQALFYKTWDLGHNTSESMTLCIWKFTIGDVIAIILNILSTRIDILSEYVKAPLIID